MKNIIESAHLDDDFRHYLQLKAKLLGIKGATAVYEHDGNIHIVSAPEQVSEVGVWTDVSKGILPPEDEFVVWLGHDNEIPFISDLPDDYYYEDGKLMVYEKHVTHFCRLPGFPRSCMMSMEKCAKI